MKIIISCSPKPDEYYVIITDRNNGQSYGTKCQVVIKTNYPLKTSVGIQSAWNYNLAVNSN